MNGSRRRLAPRSSLHRDLPRGALEPGTLSLSSCVCGRSNNEWRNQLILKGKVAQTIFLSVIIGLIYLQLGARGGWTTRPRVVVKAHAQRVDAGAPPPCCTSWILAPLRLRPVRVCVAGDDEQSVQDRTGSLFIVVVQVRRRRALRPPPPPPDLPAGAAGRGGASPAPQAAAKRALPPFFRAHASKAEPLECADCCCRACLPA